jgi:tight adherence protein B
MSTFQTLFVVAAFLAVVLLLEGGYLAWHRHRGPEARRLSQRLEALAAGGQSQEVAIVKSRLLAKAPALDRLLYKIPRVQALDRLLLQSGSALTVAGLLGLVVGLAVGAAAVAALLRLPWWLMLAAPVAAALLPPAYVLAVRARRLRRIDEQLPEALDLMSRAMRAGHAFPSALKMVGSEMPAPIADEFRVAFEEVNFGLEQHTALANLAARVPSTDLRYFVVAALIQRETGGNLAELMSSIASLIRSRLKFERSIRVLTAEGRLSAWILVLLPFALGTVVYLINPTFIGVLFTDPTGIRLVTGALVLMVVGLVWMSRLVNVRL